MVRRLATGTLRVRWRPLERVGSPHRAREVDCAEEVWRVLMGRPSRRASGGAEVHRRGSSPAATWAMVPA
jgi:hypothetical protein